MTVDKFGIGQPLRRVEDPRLVTGRGRYTDDVRPEGCLAAVVLRSPHAHARFTIRDIPAAKTLPGVHLVLTAADLTHLGDVPCLSPIQNRDGSEGHLANIPVLAKEVVRHVGDAIAFVVADTVTAARDGAEAIDVQFRSAARRL